jgi:hypothetical protein
VRVRYRRADGVAFLGCTRYPRCTFACPLPPNMDLLQRENTALRADNADLRQRIDIMTYLYNSQSMLSQHRPGGETAHLRQVIRKELHGLLKTCHPDLWSGHRCAEELTKAVDSLRERVAQGAVP